MKRKCTHKHTGDESTSFLPANEGVKLHYLSPHCCRVSPAAPLQPVGHVLSLKLPDVLVLLGCNIRDVWMWNRRFI